MANVLMGWEFGGGLGHVARLLPVARGLRELGHRPVFVVRNPLAAATLFNGDEFPVRQIPPLSFVRGAASAGVFQAGSYADILHVHAFGDHDSLQAGLVAWDRIFEEIQPKLIVFKHAPRLSLAALGRIEAIHVGTGYTCPPTDADLFPAIRADTAAVANQAELLQVIRDVQRRRGASVPERLTDVLTCRNQFVTVWPQLDPYCALRRLPAIGPLDVMPAPDEKTIRHTEFFAYLSGEAVGIKTVIGALVRSGLPGKVYLRAATVEQQRFLRAAGVDPEPRAVPLDEVLPGVPLVVHHGGAGVAGRCLSAACCQIILPRYQEQKLTGECVEALHTGRSFFGNVRLSAVVEAAQTLTDSNHRRRAFELAKGLSQSRSRPVVEAVLDACTACL